VGPRKLYYIGPRSPWKGAIIRGNNMPGHARRHSAMSCTKMAELIDLQFGLWTLVSRRKHNSNRVRQVAPMCPDGMTHWLHLANMSEPSICGGDAAVCQITLTTCFLCYFLRLKVTIKVWVQLALLNVKYCLSEQPVKC